MITYYLLQHLFLAVGLAFCAVALPKFFHLSALPRALLAASLTPQVTGLIVMLLAYVGVNSPYFYIYAPSALGLLLVVLASSHFFRHYSWHYIKRARISPAGLIVIFIGALLILQLSSVLHDNANAFNVNRHDFNVYMSGAKAFVANPSVDSIPSFYGKLGEIIVVHPHSFIFEAYLAQALMLSGPDLSFPPLDFLSRLAQQLTIIYLLVAVAGATVLMCKSWVIVAAAALVLYVPWVPYISESLSRDAFRIAPTFGFIMLLGSLHLNFSSDLMKRGLMAGAFASLMIMSHTLGLILGTLIGACVLIYVIVSRRPSFSSLSAYVFPLMFVIGFSILRYVNYYIDTGQIMGYGLNYSVYKGTWLEPLLGDAWLNSTMGWIAILETLLRRYDIYFQYLTLSIAFLAVMFCRQRGRVFYLSLLIGVWVPLLVTVSGVLDYAGINLRNALLANGRYPLSFFLLSAPLLAAGVARFGSILSMRLNLHFALRQVSVVIITGLATLFAFQTFRTAGVATPLALQPFNVGYVRESPVLPWLSSPSKIEDINHIRAIRKVIGCLNQGENWFVDSDRWNVFLLEHPPTFAFTLAARPLLKAHDQVEIESLFDSMHLKIAVFIESPKVWRQSPLYEYVKSNWIRIQMTGGDRNPELWLSPDVAECIGHKSK